MTYSSSVPAADPPAAVRDVPGLGPLALRIRDLSIERWGLDRAVEAIGTSPAFAAMLTKLEKIARYREPVLLTGESGAGKEVVAQALYLLGQPRGRPYVSVSCPQFQDGNLTVSELFGHQKGSFTGAITDHTGAFEQAHGGAIFLDEIADLQPNAQAMLLRALATGEFRPIGATRARSVDVRVIAATNRPLNQMMLSGEFRHDLFFRLRHFHIEVPPLRARGDDWKLMMEACLQRLCRTYGATRRLSPRSEATLANYTWPGNVRQLIGVATSGYAMADGVSIEPEDFAAHLETEDATMMPALSAASASASATPVAQAVQATQAADQSELFDDVIARDRDFWSTVYARFMNRDLNRREMKTFVRAGLQAAHGNYRRLIGLLRLPDSDYQRFMDFLRHHDLKP
jgi:DNA-binding NtrC family response regulator